MRHKLLSIAQGLRLPSICILCNQFHKSNLAVCTHCIELLPTLEPACIHCAFPLPNTDYLVCGYCIKNPPHFDASTINYRFEEPLRGIVHRFKYHNGLYLGPFLGQLILNAWEKKPSYPQCLIPVPMHNQKLKTRGFNQTIVLTRFLAKRLKIPYDPHRCKKIINTLPQAQLSGKNRTHNMNNVFTAPLLPYHHVALVDDLLTTGSTANELARLLKRSGVQRVEVWCCARTVTKFL